VSECRREGCPSLAFDDGLCCYHGKQLAGLITNTRGLGARDIIPAPITPAERQAAERRRSAYFEELLRRQRDRTL